MPRYSAKLMEHFQSPRNQGKLPSPDCIGIVGTPGVGHFTIFELHLKNGVIADCRFQTHGCGTAIACASSLTELAVGRAIPDALAITAEQLAASLDGIPSDKQHCAAAAIAALHNAFKDRA